MPALSLLSVIDNEGVSDVADSIAVKVSASWTVGNGADVVQVVSPSATVTLGIAADLQYKGLCDGVVLVAVRASSVVTYNSRDVLSNLWNGETTHNKTAQAEIVGAVSGQACDVDS